MADVISSKEVQKIAQLARLELTGKEVAQYAEQISAILGYVSQLSEVDTENVKLTSQVTGLSNVLREDVVEVCSNPEALIRMAPEHENNLIKVKAVFDS
ncbi:asparaginyl/glutamyl-tRNA amidotransferase subunit C [bacterium CG10_46_32]|nr:MAG: asparaginyl/glutamyl-tRNA amidotransferase subunit C [bacterium CG10_46_32]PIR56535.1 MAG: Asp-tRNA(Asn)/Glu-tRNA(Gln) amidotransferase GatCAB subunit C [Parcubacteria group bacterium CG10_big_fil_rev_8_21_14_0_10_46_32]